MPLPEPPARPVPAVRRRVTRRGMLVGFARAAGAVALGLALQACQIPRLPMPPIGPAARPATPTPRPRVRRALGDTWDSRLGAVEAYRARDLADEIGVCWSRLVFQWGEVEREGPGRWNAHYFRDEILESELEGGRQIVGVLIGTAAWAADGQAQSPPRGLDLPPDDPENTWAGFVGRMAERYRGRIDHWTIWNEPDVFEASSPAPSEGGAYRLELMPAGSSVGPGDPARYVVGGPPRILVERA